MDEEYTPNAWKSITLEDTTPGHMHTFRLVFVAGSLTDAEMVKQLDDYLYRWDANRRTAAGQSPVYDPDSGTGARAIGWTNADGEPVG